MKDYEGRYLIGFQDGTFKAKKATSSIQSQFQVEPIDGISTVAFRNSLGKYLRAKDDNTLEWTWITTTIAANTTTTTESRLIFTKEQKADKTAFKTHRNVYLSVSEDGTVVSGVSTVGPRELFEIEQMCKIGNFILGVQKNYDFLNSN